MLDRERVIQAFQTAVTELKGAILRRETSITKIADTACGVYSRDLPAETKKPSVWTFRACVLGGRAIPEILDLIESIRFAKMGRIDRTRLVESFRRAIEGGARATGKKLRPRTIAVHAHRFYCEGLAPGEKPPALVSFTQRVTGKTSDAEILNLLKEKGIESRVHAPLDRARLLSAFTECLEKFQFRIEKGGTRPLHVADHAHRIYTEGLAKSELKPSPLTFRRLIYGQSADPDISLLLQPHFNKKDV